MKPNTRIDNFLAKIAGDPDANEAMIPRSPEEYYLDQIAQNGGSGGGGGIEAVADALISITFNENEEIDSYSIDKGVLDDVYAKLTNGDYTLIQVRFINPNVTMMELPLFGLDPNVPDTVFFQTSQYGAIKWDSNGISYVH